MNQLMPETRTSCLHGKRWATYGCQLHTADVKAGFLSELAQQKAKKEREPMIQDECV